MSAVIYIQEEILTLSKSVYQSVNLREGIRHRIHVQEQVSESNFQFLIIYSSFIFFGPK